MQVAWQALIISLVPRGWHERYIHGDDTTCKWTHCKGHRCVTNGHTILKKTRRDTRIDMATAAATTSAPTSVLKGQLGRVRGPLDSGYATRVISSGPQRHVMPSGVGTMILRMATQPSPGRAPQQQSWRPTARACSPRNRRLAAGEAVTLLQPPSPFSRCFNMDGNVVSAE